MINPRRFAASIIAAALLSVSMPALADPVDTFERINIRTSDIDFSRADAAEQLQNRVDRAIAKACGPMYSTARNVVAELEACRADARTSVAPQVRKLLATTGQQVAVN